MAQTSFNERLDRLAAKAPATPQPAPGMRPRAPRARPPLLARVALFVVFFLLGFVAGFMTKLALDPEMTSDGVHYMKLMIGVAVFHIALIACVLAALFTRFERPVLNRIVIHSLIGYGVAGALLRLALT